MLTLNPTSLKQPKFSIDYPRSSSLLDQLYELDCEAYGKHAVDRSILERWVSQCPASITLIMDEGTIAGAFGLLAVSEEQVRQFIAGDLKEENFESLPDDVEDHRFWYWSGIVLAKKYRRSRLSPLRKLLSWGVDCWLTSDRLAEKAYVYATGCTIEGENLLERFKFEQIRTGKEMEDGVPLFVREIHGLEKTRSEMQELLNAPS
jgi:hypothetical protein